MLIYFVRLGLSQGSSKRGGGGGGGNCYTVILWRRYQRFLKFKTRYKLTMELSTFNREKRRRELLQSQELKERKKKRNYFTWAEWFTTVQSRRREVLLSNCIVRNENSYNYNSLSPTRFPSLISRIVSVDVKHHAYLLKVSYSLSLICQIDIWGHYWNSTPSSSYNRTAAAKTVIVINY